jgi:hypothetical protein
MPGVDVQHERVIDLIASGNVVVEEARINVQIARNADGVPLAKIADGPFLLLPSWRFVVCCLSCVAAAGRLST